jgi:mRNA-degrading endonuclease RelE of RelBE toxin-antitoxin system
MNRYTVTYTSAALDSLAGQWLTSPNRGAITNAGDEIDRQLAIDPHNLGQELREGLYRLIVAPLRVLFTIEDGDRTVTIWAVAIIG